GHLAPEQELAEGPEVAFAPPEVEERVHLLEGDRLFGQFERERVGAAFDEAATRERRTAIAEHVRNRVRVDLVFIIPVGPLILDQGHFLGFGTAMNTFADGIAAEVVGQARLEVELPLAVHLLAREGRSALEPETLRPPAGISEGPR